MKEESVFNSCKRAGQVFVLACVWLFLVELTPQSKITDFQFFALLAIYAYICHKLDKYLFLK